MYAFRITCWALIFIFRKQQTITTEVAYNMTIILRSLRAVNVAYYGVEGKSATLVIDLFDIAHTCSRSFWYLKGGLSPGLPPSP